MAKKFATYKAVSDKIGGDGYLRSSTRFIPKGTIVEEYPNVNTSKLNGYGTYEFVPIDNIENKPTSGTLGFTSIYVMFSHYYAPSGVTISDNRVGHIKGILVIQDASSTNYGSVYTSQENYGSSQITDWRIGESDQYDFVVFKDISAPFYNTDIIQVWLVLYSEYDSVLLYNNRNIESINNTMNYYRLASGKNYNTGSTYSKDFGTSPYLYQSTITETGGQVPSTRDWFMKIPIFGKSENEASNTMTIGEQLVPGYQLSTQLGETNYFPAPLGFNMQYQYGTGTGIGSWNYVLGI